MQMTTINSLDSPINLPLTNTETKLEILHHLFDFHTNPSNIWEDTPVPDSGPYFSYYTEQCSGALHDRGRHVLVRTHQDIIDVAQHIKSSLCRDCIKEKLRSKLTLPKPTNEAEKILDASIDLVTRLLLMIDFGYVQYGYRGRRRQVWVVESLKKWTDSYFGARVLEKESVKLEKTFNAMNLESIAEIEIKWTDNLADHLSLDLDDKEVAIFHHASFLKYQGKRYPFPRTLKPHFMLILVVTCFPTNLQMKL